MKINYNTVIIWKILRKFIKYQGWKGHWTVNCTGPKTVSKLFHQLFKSLDGVILFINIRNVHYFNVDCPIPSWSKISFWVYVRVCVRWSLYARRHCKILHIQTDGQAIKSRVAALRKSLRFVVIIVCLHRLCVYLILLLNITFTQIT